jgi:hypothetical protein
MSLPEIIAHREAHRIGLQMKSLRILGLANEIAQDRVANETTPTLQM